MIVIKEDGGCPIKLWVSSLNNVEAGAMEQLKQLSLMPFVKPHISVMPDVHIGQGACIGSVIPTTDAIIPSAVGVDIGCGMVAIQTDLKDGDLTNLTTLRHDIEGTIPNGRSDHGGHKDIGGWRGRITDRIRNVWDEELATGFEYINTHIHDVSRTNNINHLGTLGTGNHFIEISKDQDGSIWVMVHSGSRGVGNRLGVLSIRQAKDLMDKFHISLPNPDLAYFPRDTQECADYLEVVNWCQHFAKLNRILMVESALHVLSDHVREVVHEQNRISCHHNYVRQENHFGNNLFITRKGAIRAGGKVDKEGEWCGDWGIIPGSMGTKSYIVRGKGNKESFFSASHGAGRKLSRKAAKATFDNLDVMEQTQGVECKKDHSILDEIPGAYKDIDTVIDLQKDLIDVQHVLHPILCVKG